MTSDNDVAQAVGPAPILWITGLSGAGKSTLARAFVRELQVQGQCPLLLDGDALRDALEPPGQAMNHHVEMRMQRAWRLAKLARLAALQGVPVVVATISLFHVVQSWNRMGPTPYAEVLLHASLETLRERKPERYGSVNNPPLRDLVGIDIVAEFPREPELLIMQRFVPEDLSGHCSRVLALWQSLMQRQVPKT